MRRESYCQVRRSHSLKTHGKNTEDGRNQWDTGVPWAASQFTLYDYRRGGPAHWEREQECPQLLVKAFWWAELCDGHEGG